uniref:LisH domain-containing protein n=1 Tax=Plectus sambesii TaxID=2011161 RepID=A0A914WBY5_9BILA
MSMYAPNNRKGPPPGPGQQPQQCPSDAQAREKLALYVYEYLIHTGAKQSAETFLKEINWQKQISVSDAPGFLQSWWCVFWDLYCAAPERRETCDHSMEAKAFHDHGFVNSGGFLNGMHQVRFLSLFFACCFARQSGSSAGALAGLAGRC